MLMTPFPPGRLRRVPGGRAPVHGAAGEWQELLRQSSVGDGSIPLGAALLRRLRARGPLGGFAGDASGMHGLNRLGSHSSNGSDPIGMYMNFDGHGAGPARWGAASGGDLAGQAGGGGSTARRRVRWGAIRR